jgi:hypothetical protein
VPARQADSAPGGVEEPDLTLFFVAASADEDRAGEALEAIARSWKDGYAAMFIDIARLMPGRPRPPRQSGSGFRDEGSTPGGWANDAGSNPSAAGGGAAAASAGSPIRARLIRFLEQQTGKRFGDDLDRWRRWIWSLPYAPHSQYAYFKGGVLGNIDPRMRDFFPRSVASTIRLDQVDWGGVGVGGIPLLDHPQTIEASAAKWLKPKHVVFGIVADGVARAYPKRIVAWHEMVRDRLGDVELTLVYCTLCGAVIPYDSRVDDRSFTLATSGLLYRSNKLMFDAETSSLWSSLYGKPVVGQLADSGIRLDRLPVVTTTWGEWLAAHPDTTVLSLDTGHDRDYAEGAAYRDYFRTDRLMFAVPATDDRLKNKAEVLVFPGHDGASAGVPPLAIDTAYLGRNRIYQLRRGDVELLVLTTPKGANHVYAGDAPEFSGWLDDGRVEDESGQAWRMGDDALEREDGAQRLERVPAYRVFWFGWYAQHPDTDLIR